MDSMIIFLLKSHMYNHPTQWVGVKTGLWMLTTDLILSLSLKDSMSSTLDLQHSR